MKSDAIISEILAKLEDNGMIEIVGVDDTGDFCFGITDSGRQLVEEK